jgi:RimJ/RimL family protein N-acetyltransferase
VLPSDDGPLYRLPMPAIRLEPLGPHHVADVAALVVDADVQRYTRVPSPPVPGFAESMVARYVHGRAAGTCEGFAIVDDGGRFVGIAVAPRIDANTRTIELGYVVAPAARGRGIAVEALRRLTDWALDERGALRIELLISPGNVGSSRTAARCGYQREGILRSLYFKQDLREDTELWSFLPADRR